MEEKKWCVYKHTAPNGKVYIGITSQSVSRRWQNGNGYKTNKYFWWAIQKYKWDNFKHEIIEENLTYLQAEEEEKSYIKIYNSNNRMYGYNIEAGGNACKTLSEETKLKISQAKKGKRYSDDFKEKRRNYMLSDKNPRLGKSINYQLGLKRSLQTKKILSDKAKQRFSNPANHPMYGKNHSDETKQKIGIKSRGKPIECFTLNGEFVKRYEYKRLVINDGFNESSVGSCLHGRNKTAGGYIWRYADEVEENDI